MGNDGGSIPKRRELVKTTARPPTTSEVKATALESLSHSWTHCRLTDAPLDPGSTTIASDGLGRLYSYEAVLSALASASASAEQNNNTAALADELAALGIHNVRDVVVLHADVVTLAGGSSSWVCHLSRRELGPATRTVYLVPCGHVFAEAALRESRAAADRACPACGDDNAAAAAFSESDTVIPILPTAPADLARLAARIEDLRARGLSHRLMRGRNGAGGKKRRKGGGEVGAEDKRRRLLQEIPVVNGSVSGTAAEKEGEKEEEDGEKDKKSRKRSRT